MIFTVEGAEPRLKIENFGELKNKDNATSAHLNKKRLNPLIRNTKWDTFFECTPQPLLQILDIYG